MLRRLALQQQQQQTRAATKDQDDDVDREMRNQLPLLICFFVLRKKERNDDAILNDSASAIFIFVFLPNIYKRSICLRSRRYGKLFKSVVIRPPVRPSVCVWRCDGRSNFQPFLARNCGGGGGGGGRGEEENRVSAY